MNFSAFSIRNPVPAILLFILLTIGGMLAFSWLKVQNFPDMDLPTISISASLDGAAPSQLETEVARIIEDSLASLTYLDHITTTITDGLVSIQVSFELEKDTEEALNEVRNAVDSVTADLPAQMRSPNVTKVTLQSSPLVTYSVKSSRLDETELSWFIDNDMTKALLTVPGVGEVSRIGGVDREIHVKLDTTTMGTFGVTAATVNSQLKSVQADTSGGLGEVGGTRQTIRTMGAVASVEELRGLNIFLRNDQSIRLDQVAEVTDSFAERTSQAFLDFAPIIAVQIKRSNGFSDTGVAADVSAAIEKFAEQHPDVEIRQAYTTTGRILDNYDGSMHMLWEGAILAVLVVLLFLKDWRATLLSAVALPLSIIPTFLVMYLSGFSLNIVTLLALSLVVGILVDDAIVEIENIARHLALGKSPMEAATEAADEIGLAVIATTFTLVAVFLPTAFMSGIPGLLFRQFGVTAAVAVLASLVVARLLTPMMAAYFMKAHPVGEKDGRIMKTYLSLVRACLAHRKTTLAVTVAIVALSLSAIPYLKSGFLPASDDAQTQITLTLQPGSTIDHTRDAANRTVELIRQVPEISSVFVSIGTASAGSGPSATTTSDVATATLVVSLKAIDERSRSQVEVEEEIRRLLARVPGAQVAVGSGGNGTKLDITLAGDDANVLEDASRSLEEELRTLSGIGAVTSTASRQAPEIQIAPDFVQAAALGVTSNAIAEAVRVATNGAYSSDLPKLNLPQRQIPIVVRFSDDARLSLDEIKNLRLDGTNGSVTLDAVADISIGGSPSQIDRIDRMRNITVSVELNGKASGDVYAQAKALPALAHLPAGVQLVEQGEVQRTSEMFTSFAIAMGIGVFCIYAVLVLLFHDFLQPVTILMALPLAIGGALLPLFLADMSFSLSAVIGLLMLMGIVTKNSILLVEYAIMSRQRGMARFEALVDACHKRARPIIMTTIAMGAGMLPVALNMTGGDGSFRQPMAVVVIGGVVMSTFLSLLIIPVIFTFVDDFENLLRRIVHPRRPAAGTDTIGT
jgi:multidrug efflux pump subunit AcrB